MRTGLEQLAENADWVRAVIRASLRVDRVDGFFISPHGREILKERG